MLFAVEAQRPYTFRIVPVYVDDITFVSKVQETLDQVVLELSKHFKSQDLGPTRFLPGIQIERDWESVLSASVSASTLWTSWNSSANPRSAHVSTLSHLFCYLQGTKDLKLVYSATKDTSEFFVTYTMLTLYSNTSLLVTFFSFY
jgi:hypothetical protein